jgi:hypothetical protein
MYVCVCVCVCVCLYVCIYMYVCIYVYIYTYVHTYIDIPAMLRRTLGTKNGDTLRWLPASTALPAETMSDSAPIPPPVMRGRGGAVLVGYACMC